MNNVASFSELCVMAMLMAVIVNDKLFKYFAWYSACSLNIVHTKTDFWVNNAQFLSEQYTVYECTIFSLWVKNVQFLSEQEWMMLSLWVNNVQFMGEQCLVFELILLSFWVNNVEFMSE